MSQPVLSEISLRDRILTRYYQTEWRGFARAWGLLRALGSSAQLLAVNKYGAKFYLDPHNYIDSYVLKTGYYESEIIEAILPFLSADSVFWDIGANFGLHAITAKFLKQSVRVIAIEPSPIMAAQLKKNCRLNQTNIELLNIALSDRAKFQVLHLLDGNSGMSTLKPIQNAQYSDTCICWCDTADNLVLNHNLPQPTIIKIDVEGSELEVFQGMHHVLSQPTLQAIVFEEHQNLLDVKDHPLSQLLSSYQFTIKPLFRQENTHHSLGNFIALKNS